MKKWFLIATAVFAVSGPASAGPGGRAGWHVNQPPRFMVSAVMKKDGTADVIKPVHGIVMAADEGAAVSAFSKSARQAYPGYTIISTLADPVPMVGFCESNI